MKNATLFPFVHFFLFNFSVVIISYNFCTSYKNSLVCVLFSDQFQISFRKDSSNSFDKPETPSKLVDQTTFGPILQCCYLDWLIFQISAKLRVSAFILHAYSAYSFCLKLIIIPSDLNLLFEPVWLCVHVFLCYLA